MSDDSIRKKEGERIQKSRRWKTGPDGIQQGRKRKISRFCVTTRQFLLLSLSLTCCAPDLKGAVSRRCAKQHVVSEKYKAEGSSSLLCGKAERRGLSATVAFIMSAALYSKWCSEMARGDDATVAFIMSAALYSKWCSGLARGEDAQEAEFEGAWLILAEAQCNW
jgi:hypothetical protein